MSAADQLFAALRRHAGARRRLSLDEVWCAFSEALPGYRGDPEARPRLADLLDELAAAEQVERPRSPARWDRTVVPALPMWIRLPRAPRAAAPAEHRAIAWPPELAFVSGLRQVPVDDLLAIRGFLIDGGAARPLVPLRERSVELFGDEKRLDTLRKTGLFGDGRLSLEVLRCYEVAPPLVWEVGPASARGSILVIENLHTYDSFRRWNRHTGAYAAIAYGHGSEFHATVRDLPRLLDELQAPEAVYFGDLDRLGIDIATQAAAWLAGRGARLLPARRWYELLLDVALDRRLPAPPQDLPERSAAWLGPELAARTRALLQAGYRAPQELVGWDLLQTAR